LVLLVGGGAGAFLLLGNGNGVAEATPTPLASATAEPSAVPSPSLLPSLAPASETPDASVLPSPTPEPTPEVGDQFAFYEVSLAPDEYTLYLLDGGGDVADTRVTSFGNYSFAQAVPTEGGDDAVYWVTQDGDLAGWSYRYPDSGDFRVRAVFLNQARERRSEYLEEGELTEVPEATPAP
jgi:hypothetical protein